MSPKDAFLIFGLSEGATWAEVQRRYKEEAVAWHPDRFSTGSAQYERAQERLKQLNEARDCLRTALQDPVSLTPALSVPPLEREAEDVPSHQAHYPFRFPAGQWGLGAACGGGIALGVGWLFGVNLMVALAIGVVTGGLAGGFSTEARPDWKAKDGPVN
ncbi:MAG TPA: J domain-containing protein [Planctomicrobium sp.]|nr:J domain-containing protein [Planctomicrobium sp.]